MSDAKSAAEARRAKILARGSSKANAVTVASSEDAVDEDLYNSLANPKEKSGESSRPIAARRRMISSKSSSDFAAVDRPTKPADDEANSNPPTSPVKEDVKSEEPSTKEETTPVVTETKVEEKVASSTDKSNDQSLAEPTGQQQQQQSAQKSALPPAKTLEEVEKEIAEATKKADEKTLGSAKPSRISRKSATAVATPAGMALKVKPIAIDPSNIMRLIRVIMIILLAAFTGYRTVENSRLEAIKVKSLEAVMAVKTADFDFDNTAADFQFDSVPQIPTTTSIPSEEPTKSRTWGEYFQDKLTRQVECSVTAVGLVWWMSKFFSPVVQSQFKQEPKQMKPLEMVMEFLTNGINAFKETIYSSIGEIALHFFVLVASVTLFTIYFSAEMNDAGNGNSPAINNVEL